MRGPGVILAAAAALAAGLLAGCDRGRDQRRAPPETASPPASVGAGSVELLVNGQVVATVRSQDVPRRRALAAWLPAAARDPASWQWLGAVSRRAAKLHLPTPATRYHAHEFDLFIDAAGQLAVGIFRQDSAGLSADDRVALAKPVMALGDPARIEVWTKPKPSDEPAGYALVVRTPAGDVELTARELAALARVPLGDALGPRERAPGESKRDRQKAEGWRLDAVMAAARLPAVGLVRVVVADQQVTTVAASRSTLGVNRRGLFSVYTLGPSGDIARLRNVIRLEPAAP